MKMIACLAIMVIALFCGCGDYTKQGQIDKMAERMPRIEEEWEGTVLQVSNPISAVPTYYLVERNDKTIVGIFSARKVNPGEKVKLVLVRHADSSGSSQLTTFIAEPE